MSAREAWLNGETWATWPWVALLLNVPLVGFNAHLIALRASFEQRTNVVDGHSAMEYRCVARAAVEAYAESVHAQLGQKLLEKL